MWKHPPTYHVLLDTHTQSFFYIYVVYSQPNVQSIINYHKSAPHFWGAGSALAPFRMTVVRWLLIGCSWCLLKPARLWLAERWAMCLAPANRERPPGNATVRLNSVSKTCEEVCKEHLKKFRLSLFSNTCRLGQLYLKCSMDEPNIVTCTAPVNIAVIKYCKYHVMLNLVFKCGLDSKKRDILSHGG